MTDASQPNEDEFLAAEFALGFLGDVEKLSAMRRLAEDAQFAADVQRWQRLAGGWVGALPGDPADPRIWARIEAGLGGDVSENRPPAMNKASARTWRRRTFLATAASVVLAIALGTVYLADRDARNESASASGDVRVAQITDPAGTPLVSALYRPEEGILEVRIGLRATGGKVPELWVVDPDGDAHSLGLFGQGNRASSTPATHLRALLVNEATLAITLEPGDGARHDEPSGQVLGSTKLKTI